MPLTLERLSLSEISKAYDKSINDSSLLATIDLQRCGGTVLKALGRASAALQSATEQVGRVIAQIKTLLQLADDHINSVDFAKVARHRLQLHTDTSLLLAAFELHRLSSLIDGPSSREPWLRIIQGLDRATIISGAIGDRRAEWIQGCIRLAQRELSSLPVPLDPVNSRHKRRRIDTPENDLPSIFSQRAIPDASAYPTMETYRSSACRSPLILRRALLSENGPCPPWAAIGRWKSPGYLLDLVGDGRIVPVEIGSAYDDSGWTQAIVPFRSFLRRAGFDVQVDHEEDELIPVPPDGPWYLAQYEICRQFPALETDFTLPDYVWSEPDPGDDGPNLPSRLKDPAVNIWFGPGGSQVTTPAHTDPHFNCFTQVVGRKRVWVAPPGCTPHMSAHGRTSDSGSVASEYMTNTSTVPIFRPHATADTLSSAYPAFCKHVRPQAMEAFLDPGDMLLLPPGWWHAMQGVGEGPGCSISIWF